MTITPENMARHELIGLLTEVESSTNPCLVSISGKIVDETRNTFLIETLRGLKRIPKSNTSLVVTLPSGQKVRVAGRVLISQPENRINKKIQRARWKL